MTITKIKTIEPLKDKPWMWTVKIKLTFPDVVPGTKPDGVLEAKIENISLSKDSAQLTLDNDTFHEYKMPQNITINGKECALPPPNTKDEYNYAYDIEGISFTDQHVLESAYTALKNTFVTPLHTGCKSPHHIYIINDIKYNPTEGFYDPEVDYLAGVQFIDFELETI